MPVGRHRRTLPAQTRLLRWGALTTLSLTGAAAVSLALALDPVDQTVRTSVAAGQAAATTGSATATRSSERAASRSLARTEPGPQPSAVPPGPRMTDVAALSIPAVGTDDPTSAAEATVDLVPRWVTANLNVRADPDEASNLLTVLDAGGKVRVTGVTRGEWAQIARADRLAWVHKDFLVRNPPVVTAAADNADGSAGSNGGGNAQVSGSPCPDGSSVESGLTTNTIAVYRSACAAFPSVSSWGGRSGSGDHGAGRALDIMVSGSTGDAIADYVRAHAGALGVSEVIWSQRIWTVQRGSEGWRPMSDRGSSTANHYDHVHVSVY